MEIVKDIEIDVGHRITQHDSKCRNIHGHRLKFRIYATTAELDNVGRVVDFSVLKNVVGKWLNDELDHVFIANPKDPVIAVLRSMNQGFRIYPMRFTATACAYSFCFGTGGLGFRHADGVAARITLNFEALTTSIEPTSENIARMVFEQSVLFCLNDVRLKGVEITRIDCYETPSSVAIYTRDDLLYSWRQLFEIRPEPTGVVPWYKGFLV